MVGKVVAFITRLGPAGPDLLVFDHPLAGVRVPAGTLEPDEDPLAGARREAREETGIDHLRLVDPYGSRDEGDQVRHFFHFVSDVETAEEWWVVTPDGDGLCWRCNWTPLSEVRLVAGQQEWLDPVRTRLASAAEQQPPPRRRSVLDPRYRNATTFEVFWAPPFGGRHTVCSWLNPEQMESPEVAERVLGVCFTVDGRVVLLSGDGTSWNLPGGGREHGESIEETLGREVYEEACAHVLASTLVGYDRFVEVGGDGNVISVSHQARYAARVALEPFAARHETAGRMLVDLDDTPAWLPTWQPESLRRLLDLADAATGAPGWMVVELATGRSGLRLRELTAVDAEDYYALIDRNRGHLTRHGDYAEMATIGMEQITESLTRPTDDNTRFGMWLDGRLVGRVDLVPVNPPNYVVGVWLDEATSGKGHATEACRTAIAYARSHLGATDVWAGVTHGNDRSVALFERLGFERVAELERHSRFRLAALGWLSVWAAATARTSRRVRPTW